MTKSIHDKHNHITGETFQNRIFDRMSYHSILLSISMLVDAHRLIEFAICVIFVFIYTHLTC